MNDWSNNLWCLDKDLKYLHVLVCGIWLCLVLYCFSFLIFNAETVAEAMRNACTCDAAHAFPICSPWMRQNSVSQERSSNYFTSDSPRPWYVGTNTSARSRNRRINLPPLCCVPRPDLAWFISVFRLFEDGEIGDCVRRVYPIFNPSPTNTERLQTDSSSVKSCFIPFNITKIVRLFYLLWTERRSVSGDCVIYFQITELLSSFPSRVILPLFKF